MTTIEEGDELARLIETRLLGVRPDDQDLQLEDEDWRTIIDALRSGNECLDRLCEEHGAIEVWSVSEGLAWRPLNSPAPCKRLRSQHNGARQGDKADE